MRLLTMGSEFVIEEMRKISKILNEDINQQTADGDADGTSTNNNDIETDAKADTAVTDMMSQEKGLSKLDGSLAVKNLASLLGIDNTALFSAAFNALRQGKIPNNQSQVRELAIAFYRILASDASTTSKVLNQLRRIHKKS